ncbi:MAG: 30S ribosomal protein S18 [Candidatus Brocadia sp.]|jgi:small subunit ribosomal protein S18
MTKKRFNKTSKCRFCRMGMDEVDYKDTQNLQKLTTTQGKLFSRKRSGNCARHQHSVKTAIKRARFMALLPYVT